MFDSSFLMSKVVAPRIVINSGENIAYALTCWKRYLVCELSITADAGRCLKYLLVSCSAVGAPGADLERGMLAWRPKA